MSDQTSYNYTVVRQFAVMTVVWGVVGMLVGVIIAAELIWPELDLGMPWLSYGRLRPLHTNAVIFASGSEVEIAIAAKAKLDAAGKPARVVVRVDSAATMAYPRR